MTCQNCYVTERIQIETPLKHNTLCMIGIQVSDVIDEYRVRTYPIANVGMLQANNTMCTCIFYKKQVYKKHDAQIRQKLRNI